MLQLLKPRSCWFFDVSLRSVTSALSFPRFSCPHGFLTFTAEDAAGDRSLQRARHCAGARLHLASSYPHCSAAVTIGFVFAGEGSERLRCWAEITQHCEQQGWDSRPELIGRAFCSAALSQQEQGPELLDARD